MNHTDRKILDAAIRCIEKWGVECVTVRRIAAEAGVNVAAVNYHFGSKERLMARVMQDTLQNAFNLQPLHGMSDASPLERLQTLFFHILKGAQDYPKITRAHAYKLLIERDEKAAAAVNGFVKNAAQAVKGNAAEPDEQHLRRVVMHMLYAALCIGLNASPYRELTGEDLSDPAQMRAYTGWLADALLSKEAP